MEKYSILYSQAYNRLTLSNSTAILCHVCKNVDFINLLEYIEHLKNHHGNNDLAQQLINHDVSRLFNLMLEGKENFFFLNKCEKLKEKVADLTYGICFCQECNIDEEELFQYLHHLHTHHSDTKQGEIKIFQDLFESEYQIEDIFQMAEKYISFQSNNQNLYEKTISFYLNQDEQMFSNIISCITNQWNLIAVNYYHGDDDLKIIFEKIIH